MVCTVLALVLVENWYFQGYLEVFFLNQIGFAFMSKLGCNTNLIALDFDDF